MNIKRTIINTALILISTVSALPASENGINEALLKMINTSGDETSCTISSNKKLVIFARKPQGSNNSDLYFSEYKNDKWTEPVPVSALNSESDDISPCLSRDGNTVYFSSNRPGSLKYRSTPEPSFDIYYSEKKEGGWEKPDQLFGVINTREDETWPSVSPDGNTIYFARETTGENSKTSIIRVSKQNDIWEDVQKINLTANNYIPSMAVKSDYRNIYIFTAYRESSKSRDIFFTPVSGENSGAVTEDPEVNTTGDEISFYEINNNELLISTNYNSISGSYDIFLKKISDTTASEITELAITIKTVIKGYDSTEGTNIKILYFNSDKHGEEPVKSEVCVPDSNGEIKLTVKSGIKRIIAIPANADMKEFVLEIFPDKKTEPPVITIEKKSETEFKIRPVFFHFNSSELMLEEIPYIYALLNYLRKNEHITLSIEGYADRAGSCRVNRNISLARAEKVRKYLIKLGIDKSRLKIKGHGFIQKKPEDTSQYNRRVEFIISK